ncbi:MAG: amidohydrolase family protein [Bacteroidota bacterium]
MTDEEGKMNRVTNLTTAPGLMDLQVNGYAGTDVNSENLQPADLKDMSVKLWSEGVTTWFPTVITNSNENIIRSLKIISEACRLHNEAKTSIGGIHLEGPFISPEEGPRGAHPSAHVMPPAWDPFSRWQEASGGIIKIVTLSPEWPQSPDFIRRCVRSGVIAAIGHTAAEPEQIREAVDAGATLSTHLGNASHQMLPRHHNYIWEQLAADNLYISIISDSFHLPDSVLKVFLKVKQGKTILVSDSTQFTRMKPGDYSTHIGGEVTLTPAGKLHIKGMPNVLAGSGLSLLHCVNTLISKKLASPAEAWDMASVVPTKFTGLLNPSDQVMMELTDEGYVIRKTIKAGKVVYKKV